MELISNKDIFLLMMDTLRLRNPQIVEHGFRTAYIMYRMLQCKGGYEPFELADITIYTSLHDLGAYVTEKQETLLTYDVKDYMPHCVSSFLMCKHLSPHAEMAPVLLHHHVDYKRLAKLKEWERELSALLNIAERMEIYHSSLGERFDCRMFDRLKNRHLWAEGMDYLYQAEQKYQIFRRLDNGNFRRDMDELLDYMIFSNEEQDKYLESLLYFLGICSDYAVVDAVTCICVSRALADRLLLSMEEKQILYYAALLHDVGMLAIPRNILEAPRKLTTEERSLLETHVSRAEEVLKNRLAREVVEVILAHHERCDGSGYPRRLKANQMSRLQCLLQVANKFTDLINQRSYRPLKNKDEVTRILREDQRRGRLHKQLVETLLEDYDDIYAQTRREEAQVMSTYQKLLKDYNKVFRQYNLEESAAK